MRVYWAVLALVLLAPGCAELQDHHFRKVNHSRARHAWKTHGATCDSYGTLSRDYEKGWEAGYYEVLTGGPAVAPTVPPKQYWGPEYQTHEGQAAIEDWYSGFHAGSLLAGCAAIHSEIPLRCAAGESSCGPGCSPAHGIIDPGYQYQGEPAPAYPTFPPMVAPVPTSVNGSRRLDVPGRISNETFSQSHEEVPPAPSPRDVDDRKTPPSPATDGWSAPTSSAPLKFSANDRRARAIAAERLLASDSCIPAGISATETVGYVHICDGTLEFAQLDHLLVWKDGQVQP